RRSLARSRRSVGDGSRHRTSSRQLARFQIGPSTCVAPKRGLSKVQHEPGLLAGSSEIVRVLWVTSAFPDIKGTGGMVHELEPLRSVAPRHEIRLLTTFGVIRPEALREVKKLGVRVEVVPWEWERAYVPRGKFTKFIRLLL